MHWVISKRNNMKVIIKILLILLCFISCRNNKSSKGSIRDKPEMIAQINRILIGQILQNKEYHSERCNITYGKKYLSDSLGINDFIIHLFCDTRCHSTWMLCENYFGTSTLNNSIRISQAHAKLSTYEYVPNIELPLYVESSLNFYEEVKSEIQKSNHINDKCYLVNLFFAIVWSAREHNYENVSKFDNSLKKLYSQFDYDKLLSDMALDVLRYSTSNETMSFLEDKKYRSKEFNSFELKMFYHLDKAALKANFPYENLIQN